MAGKSSALIARDKTAILDRPIMMTAESVRSILADLKFQTRRVIDPQPVQYDFGPHRGIQPAFVNPQTLRAYDAVDIAVMVKDNFAYMKNPPFRRGGKLWVKEAFGLFSEDTASVSLGYKARLPEGKSIHDTDGGLDVVRGLTPEQRAWASQRIDQEKWRNAMFMPRWASRITLEITGVTVERLHDIDDADALAEGIQVDSSGHAIRRDDEINWGGPVPAYAEIWESLNAKRGWPWRSNPWVYGISFRRIDG